MKISRFVAALLLFTCSAAGAADSLNHIWESKFLEPLNGVWVKRKLDLKTSHYQLSFDYYDAPNGTQPILEQTYSGQANFSPNRLNSKAYDINLSVTSATILLRKKIPQLKNLKIDQCVSVGVVEDALNTNCAGFVSLRRSHAIFETMLLLDDRTALMGNSNWLPTTTQLRPTSLSIFPLVQR